jgi:hypothetical protein
MKVKQYFDKKLKELTLEEELQLKSLWNQKNAPFPWSADIPLAETGLRLNIWGNIDATYKKEAGSNNIDDWNREPPIPPQNYNFILDVPKGWMLLWRGDLIHGGALQNEAKNGALRCHWYIPMKQDDIGVIRALVTENTAQVSRSQREGGRGIADAVLGLEMPTPHQKLENIWLRHPEHANMIDEMVSTGSKRLNPSWSTKSVKYKKMAKDIQEEDQRKVIQNQALKRRRTMYL